MNQSRELQAFVSKLEKRLRELDQLRERLGAGVRTHLEERPATRLNPRHSPAPTKTGRSPSDL